MGNRVHARGVWILCLATVFSGSLAAQVDKRFSFKVNGIPAEVRGEPGAEVELTAELVLGTTGLEDGEGGVQGWSMSVANDGVDILGITTQGTVSADVNADPPGLRNNGFENSEVVDPDRKIRGVLVNRKVVPSGQGAVSAVVLSFNLPITLPQNTDQVIAITTYRATIPAKESTGLVAFRSGLAGIGQPVSNDITFASSTVNPTLGEAQFAIGPDVPDMEICNDGKDNDQDGDVDCDDADCADDPDCVPAPNDFDIEVTAEGAVDGTLTVVGGSSFETTITIGPTDPANPPSEGVQGHSLSLEHDGNALEITAATSDGTQSADVNADPPGLRNNGFENTEIVDPARNDGRNGVVQAVVLSFSLPITLDPTLDEPVLKVTYSALNANSTSSIIFPDLALRGIGQPVPVVLTVGSGSVEPTRIGLTVNVEVAPEVCDDGEDNDNDGMVDCADSDCADFPACQEAGNCADDIDNDLDGDIDCADADCADDAVCQEAGNCEDGVDNDKDGDVDCDDADCADDPACQPTPEICDDGMDNDEDGAVDCDDSDCADFPACQGGGFKIQVTGPSTVTTGSEFEAVVVIGPNDPADVPPSGVQGHSLSLEHDGSVLTIVNATAQGTRAADVNDDPPGLRNNGFENTEVVDPKRNDGRNGVVQAVVLSFSLPITLDPAVDEPVLRVTYAAAAEPGTTEIIFPKNPLRGIGQPVPVVLTVDSDTVEPTRIGLTVTLEVGVVVVFLRGDANNDAKVNIADGIWIINELFRQGPPTVCQDAADANDDGLNDLSDAMYIIDYRFRAGPTPLPPFPACGEDPTVDDLVCPPDAPNCP